MTFKICFWDDEAGEQRERDSTPAEDAQRELDIAEGSHPVVPEFVDRRQGRQALILGGHFDQVQGVIDQIEDPVDRALAQVWFDDSPLYERHHPMVAMFAAGLGMDEDDLDHLFIFAKTL